MSRVTRVIMAVTPTARLLSVIDDTARALGIDPSKHATEIARFVGKYDTRRWGTLAAAAGVRPPTARQIRLVLETIEQRAHTPASQRARTADLTRRDRKGK